MSTQPQPKSFWDCSSVLVEVERETSQLAQSDVEFQRQGLTNVIFVPRSRLPTVLDDNKSKYFEEVLFSIIAERVLHRNKKLFDELSKY